MDKATVQSKLSEAELGSLSQEIDKLTHPSIRIGSNLVDEATLKPGSSKIGGLPDVPSGVVWPDWKGVPQSFVAQIRLEDLQAYNQEKLLPASGMLWFFYDAKQETYGADVSDRGGWKILFKEGDLTDLKRAAAPEKLPKKSLFKAAAVTFSNELTISAQPDLEIAGLKWEDQDQEKYDKVFEEFHKSDDKVVPHNRMLGFADTLQDDMRQQAQLYANGLTDIEDPKAEELLKTANDWVLLLQVDSDEKAGMNWGSGGMIYYWIKKEDLQKRNFDASWLVLQSE